MKLEIPDSFPNDMKTSEIKEVIAKCSTKVTTKSRTTSSSSLGDNYYISMIALGQAELNKRIQSGHLNLFKEQNKQNRKFTLINWTLTGVTIVLAIVTLYIGNSSLEFSESDQKSDEQWQNEQINLLKKQNQNLKELNRNILKIIKNDSIL